MKSRRRRSVETETLPEEPFVTIPRVQERLLIDRLTTLDAARVICNTAGRGQFARELATASPSSSVTCLFQDLYQQQQAEQESPAPIANLRRCCEPDLPAGEVDLAVVFCATRGIAEYSRDLLQQAYDRLAHRGRLISTIDNPEDQWLHDELKKLFPKVTREPMDAGVIYSAVKTGPLGKHKQFDAEFVFRDQDRLITMQSRPGVFSHRRLDTGARALINAMQVYPSMRILDLGCGTGAVGVAAALRQPTAEVWAVDSNPRAVQCAQLSAERNAVTNLTTKLDADGTGLPTGYFDLILANPPYYSHYRLAELFLQTTARALTSDGELLLVTKAPAWFRESLPKWFRDVEERQPKEYVVFSCRRQAGDRSD